MGFFEGFYDTERASKTTLCQQKRDFFCVFVPKGLSGFETCWYSRAREEESSFPTSVWVFEGIL